MSKESIISIYVQKFERRQKYMRDMAVVTWSSHDIDRPPSRLLHRERLPSLATVQGPTKKRHQILIFPAGPIRGARQ